MKNDFTEKELSVLREQDWFNEPIRVGRGRIHTIQDTLGPNSTKTDNVIHKHVRYIGKGILLSREEICVLLDKALVLLNKEPQDNHCSVIIKEG